MKSLRFPAAAALLVALVCSVVTVSAAVKEPKDAACPVSGKKCNPEKSADFAGGKVWFCCGNCEKAFSGDPTKFAAKAHQQMVSTGQLVQKGCPFSGGPVKAGTQLAVGRRAGEHGVREDREGLRAGEVSPRTPVGWSSRPGRASRRRGPRENGLGPGPKS